ncbi:MAG: shikimate kinase [Oscillospiraceae bacterium]
MEYGLIGGVLGHSFSKPIHEMLAEYSYILCPLPTVAEFDAFMAKKDFKAINVTIPYKEKVLAYCDYIEPQAAEIGAVNTIVNKNGKLYGYNTDFKGLYYLMCSLGVAIADKHVMILGTGGTQKTAEAVARAMGAGRITAVSRHKSDIAIDYAEALAMADTEIIINTSPVGMYPNCDASPISLDNFPHLCGVVDVVYNPLTTALVADARARGIKAVNGLLMLVAQAKFASEYFTGNTIDDAEINKIELALRRERANLVLIGMPSCGKSSLGKMLAKTLGKKFVDLDAEVEKAESMPISRIFAEKGEEYFRDAETRAVKKAAMQNGMVIATGGGAVKRGENVRALRQNGVVVYIKRDIAALAIGGARPLSTNEAALLQMQKEREPLYKAAADGETDNVNIDDTALAIEEIYYEILHN